MFNLILVNGNINRSDSTLFHTFLDQQNVQCIKPKLALINLYWLTRAMFDNQLTLPGALLGS